MTRLRRSRQCRGPRARNYVRTLARANAGSYLTSKPDAVLAQAKLTGALTSHRRMMTLKLEALRRREAKDNAA